MDKIINLDDTPVSYLKRKLIENNAVENSSDNLRKKIKEKTSELNKLKSEIQNLFNDLYLEEKKKLDFAFKKDILNYNENNKIEISPILIKECKICFVESSELMAFNKCGHVCVCEKCAKLDIKQCIICNQDGDLIKFYLS